MKKIYLVLSLVLIYNIISAQDYFRSVTSGSWHSLSTWESSVDNSTWVAATIIPTNVANTIRIRSGHTVTLAASVPADQLIIENGGILKNAMPAGNSFTIENGLNDDLEIQSGGMYLISSGQGYANYQTLAAGSTVRIKTGGKIRVGEGSFLSGTGNHQLATTGTSYIWEDDSNFEWNTNVSFSTSAVTFFPDVDNVTIPVFRTMVNMGSVGASTNTRINGIFEANGSIQFTLSGQKIFRNGIRGSGAISGSASSGKFVIDGTTAELGGTGSLAVPSSGGLEIGPGTTVTMTANKTITGNVTLLNTNSLIHLGSYNLTISGTISISEVSSYVKTTGTGVLTLSNVGNTGKLFPIGNSTVNPIYIIHPVSAASYSARVVEPITPTINNNNAAVLRTWYISSPATAPNATISFGYSYPGDAGPQYSNTGPAEVGVNINGVWNIHQTGLSPAAFSILPGTYAVTPAYPINYFNGSPVEFPFVIANNGAILSRDYLIVCRGQKQNGSAIINWTIQNTENINQFEVQHSVDGGGFQTIAIVPPASNQTDYRFTDAFLPKGRTFYRIKVNKIGGGSGYSNEVAIINDSKSLLITSISPNPVRTNAMIVLNAAKHTEINFTVCDITGRPVKKWQLNLQGGENFIHVDLSYLPAGVYHLLATTFSALTIVKFIKE